MNGYMRNEYTSKTLQEPVVFNPELEERLKAHLSSVAPVVLPPPPGVPSSELVVPQPLPPVPPPVTAPSVGTAPPFTPQPGKKSVLSTALDVILEAMKAYSMGTEDYLKLQMAAAEAAKERADARAEKERQRAFEAEQASENRKFQEAQQGREITSREKIERMPVRGKGIQEQIGEVEQEIVKLNKEKTKLLMDFEQLPKQATKDQTILDYIKQTQSAIDSRLDTLRKRKWDLFNLSKAIDYSALPFRKDRETPSPSIEQMDIPKQSTPPTDINKNFHEYRNYLKQ
jgi:hypothetical protein